MKLDVAAVAAEAEAWEWVEPKLWRPGGVVHRYQTATWPGLDDAAHRFFGARVVAVRLSRIEPGGFIAPHQDGGPHRLRWHVPLTSAGSYHEAGRRRVLNKVGNAYTVHHWLPHHVINRDKVARMTMIVDVGPPLDVNGPTSFVALPMLPELEAMTRDVL